LTTPERGAFARTLRNVGWLLGGKGVGAVLSLIYLALATRSLGVERFGQFMLILSTAQAIAALVTFQSWQLIIRFGVAPLQRGDRGALGRLVGFCVALDLGAALAGCGLAAGAVAVMARYFGWSPDLARDALVFAVVLLVTVRSTAVGVLRLHDRFRTGAAADAVTPIMRFAGALAVVASEASVRGFLLAWAVAEVATAMAYWRLAVRDGSGVAWTWRGIAAVPREQPGLWHFALVTNLNATLQSASKQVIVVIVGFVSGAGAAGAYRLAFQLSQSLARLSDMFSRAVFPEFTRAHASDGDALRQLFRQSTRLTLAVGSGVCVLAPVLSEPVMRIAGGSHYAGAATLLMLLSVAAALDLMGTGFEPVLLGTGRTGAALRIRLASVAVLGIAAVVLMPGMGATGAAAATLIASALTLAMAAWTAHQAVRAGRN
jgi:O-antigen/teichoic acid export membrane protein